MASGHASTESGARTALPARIVTQLREILGKHGVLDRYEDLLVYEYDAYMDRSMPQVVVRPTSGQQVAAVVQLAARERLAVTARGGASGLSGGVIPVQGGIMIDLNLMHGILDAEQRGLFVDSLEGRLKAHHGGNHHDKGGFMHMKKLAEDLKLTDDQKSQIHGIMRDSFKSAMKAHMGGHHHVDHAAAPPAQGEKTEEAPASPEWKGAARGMPHHGGKKAIEAFRGDKLDLDAVAPAHDMKKMGRFGVEHVVTTAEKILPILTPEQRKIAAEKLRTMAAQGDSSLIVH